MVNIYGDIRYNILFDVKFLDFTQAFYISILFSFKDYCLTEKRSLSPTRLKRTGTSATIKGCFCYMLPVRL